MPRPRTLFDKIWDAHAIRTEEDGRTLLAIDRHFVHEGSFHAFDKLHRQGLGVRRPALTTAVADHYVPTTDRGRPIGDPEIATMVELLTENARRNGVRLFGLGDPRQGIVHVTGPEQGLTLPGLTVVCGDSHTSTHGAFGAWGFGIGASEVAHVLATQTLWQRRPKTLRITISGALAPGVGAKDIILSIIARIGAGGASGHVIEYAGSAIRGLDMAGRMTVCNMSIEAGARAGLIAPDETTFDWLEGRPFAPAGADWNRAVDTWRDLATEDGAVFDREETMDAAKIAPVVTWGTSPEDALPIDAAVPDPAAERDPERRRAVERAIEYMGLAPGTPLTGIAVEPRLSSGSCTICACCRLRARAGPVLRPAPGCGNRSPGSRRSTRTRSRSADRVVHRAGREWAEGVHVRCMNLRNLVTHEGRCGSTTILYLRRRSPAPHQLIAREPCVAAAVIGQ